MTVQMNNEESAIKGNTGADTGEEMKPYRDEVSRRFGDFLLMKYHSREEMKKAWTHEGVCSLGEDEDPAQGTVRGIEGGFYQSVGEPMGDWNAAEGPARYADWMEFGARMNRAFYQDMKDYLISLGVKVPIVASNLMAGAADVYGHTDGDLMENNTYFNHPLLPVQNDTYMVYGPAEYVSTNPLTVQRGIGSMGTTLLSLASVAIVQGKPEREADTLTGWLTRNEQQNKSYCHPREVRGSKKAVLEYKMLASTGRYSLLEVRLLTGRHHQIRCQLAAAGCPIKGDLKYGAKRSNPNGSISLLARRVEFTHPVSKLPIVVEAPVPDDNLWRDITAGF